jgi:hypothetical protein
MKREGDIMIIIRCLDISEAKLRAIDMSEDKDLFILKG